MLKLVIVVPSHCSALSSD